MEIEQAFNTIMYKEDNEINELRTRIVDYLNADSKEYKEKALKELILYAELKECEICGYIGLEEDMHEIGEEYQCETCWEAR